MNQRIEEMLESKREMADSLLGGGAEKALTDMNNEELVRFVSLDLNQAGMV